MQHRPLVLHICRRDHNPSLVEAVLARAGFGVLPARTLEQAAMQLRRADVIVISSCWSTEEKHTLMVGLRTASTAPLVCVTATPHGCCACTEADPFDPDALISAIQHSLAMRLAPVVPAGSLRTSL